MRRASALLKNGKILIQGYSETTSGVWIARGPVYVASVEQLDRLGQNIFDALHQSSQGVPHPGPTEWKAIQAPMLEAAGAKTWAALAKSSKAVGLECQDEVVTITPSSNYENDGGEELSDRAIRFNLKTADIGERLIEAFNSCG